MLIAQRTAEGVDGVQAASRYRKELDFVHRAPFVSVVFFFRSDKEGPNVEDHATHCRTARIIIIAQVVD